ncbi:MAG: dihydrodipicolinate synthase family protein [Betaproteobacteria bacterium]|nr:dihydrodipicolinate synthase family protein [Betaproteobacteria bacterium]
MTEPSSPAIRGLWCATLTPLARDGSVDHARFAAHVHGLFAQGVDGVAPFGTTGEGQSFSVDERRAGLDALLAAGVPGTRIVAATGCAALSDTIALTRHAAKGGCGACLVLPPFFWKEPTDDGLFAWYAQLIEKVAYPRLKIFLYHLPQVSAVPLSVDLVARLAAAFPDTVTGVKDSEGNWDHTSALLARVPQLAIMVGHEPHLPRLLRAGGAGTICGVANIFPNLVRALMTSAVTAEDEARIATFIEIAFRQPFLAGFKSILADRAGDAGWLAVRVPLTPLDDGARHRLRVALERAGLSIQVTEEHL